MYRNLYDFNLHLILSDSTSYIYFFLIKFNSNHDKIQFDKKSFYLNQLLTLQRVKKLVKIYKSTINQCIKLFFKTNFIKKKNRIKKKNS